MFAKLKLRFSKELSHYHALTVDARRLLLSYYLFFIAYPLFEIFINAFIWKQGQNIHQLVYYNIANCLGIVACFYINGLLLRHFHTTRLYIVGLFLQSLSSLMIVFTSKAMGSSLWIYGFLTGMGGGFFWANKNYLSLILTRGSNRLYYNSLESSASLVIRILIPLIAGFIISFASKSGLYTPVFAYQALMVLGLIVLLVSSYIISKSTIRDIKHEPLLIKHVTKRWGYVRIYGFIFNIIYGAEYVIPTVLVLTLLGQEGTLGLITSATAALSAASLYVLGRKGDISHVYKTVAVGNVLYTFSALLIGTFFSPLTALIYLAGMTIGKALRFSPAYTVIMEIMEKESKEGQYAYICDNEISFNSGRILGLCIILLFSIYGQEFVLRFLPFVLGFVAMLSLIPLKSMIHSLNKLDDHGTAELIK